MQIETLTYNDNYIYLLTDQSQAVVIDPSDANTVLSALENRNATLQRILITHNHADHTAGCRKLKKETGINAEKPEAESIVALNRKVCVLETPGHTSGDVCYHFPKEKAVFTGDTMFVAGCGRVFTGDYEAMWQSMLKLRDLPPETSVYCGHNYTRENLEFALSLEPENQDVANALAGTRQLNNSGKITVPSSVGREAKINLFLRADNEDLKSTLNMTELPALEVFTRLRKQKDAW